MSGQEYQGRYFAAGCLIDILQAVVGILEKMEDTLEVMEAVLPTIFVGGIAETYTGQKKVT